MKDLQEKVKAIALLMPGWWHKAPESAYNQEYWSYLTRADGAMLSFNTSQSEGRLVVHGCQPEWESWKHGTQNWPGFKMTVSQKLEPHPIAFEIGRRLLPKYDEAFRKAVEERDEKTQDKTKRRSLAAELVRELPHGTLTSDGLMIHVKGPGTIDGKVVPDENGTVTLDLDGLPPKLAKWICRAVGEWKEEP